MKSIKEKAEEYGYTNWQSDEYHDGASEGLEFDPIGHTQKTFETGANYVLDAIEKECKRIAQLCKNHVENPVDEEDKVDSWARLDEMEYMLKFIEQLKEK